MTATKRNLCAYVLKLLLFYPLIWIICGVFPAVVFSQGIQFAGSDHAIEDRTSVDVFSSDQPRFHDRLDIRFDLQLPNNGTNGYIVRLKEKNQRSVFNLYYDEEGENAVFRLNEEGKTNLITLRVGLDDLKDQHWVPFRIGFDLRQGLVQLQVASIPTQVAKVDLNSPYSPTITFGKSDYMIDVPSMALRNLQISGSKTNIVFPLKESSGTTLHNASGEAMGEVINGTWLLNKAFGWQNHISLNSSSHAGSTYDSKTKAAYYFNRDSLYIYKLQTGETTLVKFNAPCPVPLRRAGSFIEPDENRLYVYETFYNTPYTGPTVASLDLTNHTWRIESSDYLGRELNHHGRVLMPINHKLLIFGGFGDMMYSNDWVAYNLKDQAWSAAENMTGDPIFPRYFTSMGRSEVDDKIYLFGGMGNESGQHIVGRKYFYDLYAINPQTKETTKRWSLDWKGDPFVPARGLVIADSSWVYLLGYPEHLTHSHIKLRRFSLLDGNHQELGDSIPIYSDKISTRANLFYDEQQKKLIAIVQESDDDIRSKMSVYSLDFPPISEDELHAFPSGVKKSSWRSYFSVTLGVLVAAFVVYRLFRKRIKATDTNPIPIATADRSTPEITKNQFYLFGDFTVIDQQGTDISHLFSTRLQQVFCLILFYSDSAGISSKLLSHLLWPDKPKDKVKISRGVAINNLRKVLNDLNGVEIRYEEGHYRLVFQPNCYCDYREFKQQIASARGTLPIEVRQILERGEFLMGMDDPLFDKVKAEVEASLVGLLTQSILNHRENRDWKTTADEAELLLTIDPINDFALEQALFAFAKDRRKARAETIFRQFTEKYRLLTAEDYSYTFEEAWRRAVS
ncbi:MAG: Kelch repeat-containing protein [Sphingobacterium sp.]